ncbi:hypothetical protein GCM10027405_12360 [Arthrobacter alkaliphilus]|uniref:hypothetical protein n=1 Tax=Arthrobacter alkaliphilus TaxID=369936 RepID=UPI001F3A4E65|nr:hypothetical protein [Arthrobacter alkaliphilus]
MENTQGQNPEIHNPEIQNLEVQNVEFHVSYLDTLSGRIEHEDFSDLPAAERFAHAQLKDEESWAVVDVVVLQETQHQERSHRLVA